MLPLPWKIPTDSNLQELELSFINTETFITPTIDMKDFCKKWKLRMLAITKIGNKDYLFHHLGKKPALEMYEQFSLNIY